MKAAKKRAEMRTKNSINKSAGKGLNKGANVSSGKTIIGLFQCVLPVVLAVLLFGLAVWGFQDFNQLLLFDDEFGYWTASAYATGADWISVASGIPYYSYGYGLLVLTPLKLICSTGPQMYHGLILLNGLFLVGGFVLARAVATKKLNSLSPSARDLMCFLVCAYPQNLLSAHIGWTECLLVLGFWLFVWLSLRVVEQPTTVNHVALMGNVVLLYVVHQRTLAVMLATLMVLGLLYLQQANRRTKICIGMTAWSFFMAVHSFLKADILNKYYRNETSYRNVYLFAGLGVLFLLWTWIRTKRFAQYVLGGMGVLGVIVGAVWIVNSMNTEQSFVNARVAINDFSGQLEKFQMMLTADGFRMFVESVLGKWLYLTVATWFIIWWSVTGTIAKAWRYLVKKECTEDNLWQLWLLLALLGNFFIAAIYLIRPVRNDILLYGRYTEYMLGIYILLGLVNFLRDETWWMKLVAYIPITLIAGLACQTRLDQLGMKNYQAYHSIVTSLFLEKDVAVTGAVTRFAGLGLCASVAMLILLKIKFPAKIKIVRSVLLVGLITWLSIHIAYGMVGGVMTQKQDLRVRSILPIATDVTGMNYPEQLPVYYCKDTEARYWSESFQFLLQDMPLTVIDSTELQALPQGFYITGDGFVDGAGFEDKFYCVRRTAQFALVVPKGTEMEMKARKMKGE